ncbi:MAG: hypothetical protein PHV13_02350 [Candidatus ainarchaeum sp.]|nr:hypothetical protein [Candidatus ainarchaeum sp.]
MRLWQAPLLIALLASLCSAAFVHGSIYSGDLQKVNSTLIRVDGPFSYQLVTDKANYSIYLPEGNYTISASVYDQSGNTALYAEEAVKVGGEDQTMDLVLRPAWPMTYTVALLVIFIIACAFLWARRPSGPPRPRQEAPAARKTAEPDEDAEAVLRALDGFEGRATQKELKESLGFSDAKLSLILSELESLGKIRKFKRGRGNIIKKV